MGEMGDVIIVNIFFNSLCFLYVRVVDVNASEKQKVKKK